MYPRFKPRNRSLVGRLILLPLTKVAKSDETKVNHKLPSNNQPLFKENELS